MKNYFLTGILLILLGAIYLQTSPVTTEMRISVKVVKNQTNIIRIHQKRNVRYEKTLYIDEINFNTSGNMLKHRKIGSIGYDENYFVDFEAIFDVARESIYQFEIGSDDGFALFIDKKLICEFVTDRPYAISQCECSLAKGKHKMKLSYFQGYGNSGLTGKYRQVGEKEFAYIGANSDGLTFIPFPTQKKTKYVIF